MHCTYFGDLHLCKDSCQDKLAEGCEEEEAPVEAKNVDHLGAEILNFNKFSQKLFFYEPQDLYHPKGLFPQSESMQGPCTRSIFSTHPFINPPNQLSLQTCIQE